MSINALMAARTKLMTDTALNNFWQARYGKAAKHVVGYRKPVNAGDFPVICYVPVLSTPPDAVGGMTKERASLVIGIHEVGITNDVFDGVAQLSIVEALVLNCLDSGALGSNAVYLGQARITTDLGSRHPFYELEISALLASR